MKAVRLFILFTLFLLHICIAEDASPLYLAILLDESGSMLKTDPAELRKLAAQATIALLSEDDHVAIITFSADGNVIRCWTSAKQQRQLFTAIDEAGHCGQYTDFRAGLATVSKLFENAPKDVQKIILLLTDGLFEPNLQSSIYAPYHIQYRISRTGKGAKAKKRIRKEFTEHVRPVARQMILQDIIPEMKKIGVEIFTVSLGTEADVELMKMLAAKTTENPSELHSFKVDTPLDLVDAFLGIMKYARNRFILYSENGNLCKFSRKLFMDEFVREPLFIAVAENGKGFFVDSPNSNTEISVPGTHPALTLIPIKKQKPPGEWTYGFSDGSGKYKLLVVGKSILAIEVIGLKEKYIVGETISVSVKLKHIEDDSWEFKPECFNAFSEIRGVDSFSEKVELPREDDCFEFRYTPAIPGEMELEFSIYSHEDKRGQMLPRKSGTYIVRVMPRIFAEPDEISFGDISRNNTSTAPILIHYGISKAGTLEITGRITSSSRPSQDTTRLPSIVSEKIPMSPGTVNEHEVGLYIPSKSPWGNYEGVITIDAGDGQPTQRIFFTAHLPSFWEKIQVPFFVLVILLLAIIIAILLYRIRLGRPRGILRMRQMPGGNVVPDIELSKVKGGFFRRLFSKNPHIVSLRNRKADVCLPGIMQAGQIELVFYRIPNARFIRNASLPNSEIILRIEDPRFGENMEIPLEPGNTMDLRDGQKIAFEGYLFEYECF